MDSNNKENMIQSITDQIKDLDVAWYLKDEVSDFLKYLHCYKLKNVLSNMDALLEYLHFLDEENTQQIHSLEYKNSQNLNNKDCNINYYISDKWIQKLWKTKIYQKIRENDFNLNYVMQWLRWLLLLTADEFCNATPTRMSINRLLWQKQFKDQK